MATGISLSLRMSNLWFVNRCVSVCDVWPTLLFVALIACDEVDDVVRVTREALVDSICLTVDG